MVLFYRYTEIFSVQYFKSIVQSLSQYKYEIPGSSFDYESLI